MADSMIVIDEREPLNALVAREPRVLPALRLLGMDTCCGGSLPLAAAAAHHGLDIAQVKEALRRAAEQQP